MKTLRRYFILLLLLPAIHFSVWGQEDLLSLVEGMDEEETTDFAHATFKGTRIVNSQSIESPAGGVLQFMISHRFGPVSDGAYNLWGLDQSTIRIGLDYGIYDRINVGVGRSSMEKTYDGFLKVKLLRQSSGAKNMPLSVSYFGSMAVNGMKWSDPERNNYFSSRLTYVNQLLMARKFNDNLSVQLMPTLIHRNLVATAEDENDVYSVGIGARFKLTKRMSVNAEYFYLLPGKTADDYFNSFSVGFDIETGGHVFQFNFSNSLGMIENFFVTETTEDWMEGQIHIGFNISRVFTIVSNQ